MSTIEQQIKFKSGLSIGISHVNIIRRDGSKYEALVEITNRGKVSVLPKPTSSDMYTSWYRVKGDDLKIVNTIVWMARDKGAMDVFSGVIAEVVIP